MPSDTDAATGSVTVVVIDERIVECRASGHIRHEHVVAAQARLEELAGYLPDCDMALFDGRGMRSFESGIPARWVRWAFGRIGNTRRVAFVGKTRGHAAVAFTFKYLLPDLRFQVFVDRNAALAYLLAANDECRHVTSR